MRAEDGQRATLRGGRSALWATCLGTFVAILDTSVANLALHAIGAGLDAHVHALQWVMDAYNVVYAAGVLPGGVLGDRLGHRRVFLAGIALFAAGSVGCVVAPSIEVLVASRAVAGLGAALLLPTSLAILNGRFEGAERARAMALWASANGLAMAVGPTAGGALVQSLGWRSVFALVVPFAIAGGVLAWIGVERRPGVPRRLDLAGQALAAVALVALSLGLIDGPRRGWASASEALVTAVAIAAAAGFVVDQRRARSPTVPLEVFRSSRLSAAVSTAVLMTFGFYTFLFVFPLVVQARGASAVRTGVALLPLSLGFFAVSSLATGPLLARLGPRVLVGCGMGTVAAGLVGATRAATAGVDVGVSLALGLMGLGFGLVTAPVSGVAVASVTADRAGVASGLVNVARMVGATVSVALVGVWMGGDALTRDPATLGEGLRRALLVAALAEASGAAVAIRWLRRDSFSAAARRLPARDARTRAPSPVRPGA